MTAHSMIGASSMYRWAACPGSVREAKKAPPSKSSFYAEEGSDAHALGSLCLRTNTAPGQYIGEEIDEDNRKFTVDEEMANAVHDYCEYVWKNQGKTDEMLVEHKFDLSSVHPGCFGTADCVIWQPKTKLLIVVDYKHGAGIPVKVNGNPQLQYYGLGALLSLGYPAARVRLVIVQPRCENADGPVREWEIDSLDLLDFRADLVTYAKATEDPDALLNPGSHCRFCPAAALCPALEAKQKALAKAEFAPALPYDPQKLKTALDSLPEIEARIKAVREFAYTEAEAGRAVPGYKLVAKRATRKWRSEGEVIEKFQKECGDDIFEPRKLKSPAQMEKLASKKEVNDLTISESSGHTLVPEADKRQAVVLDAKSEFGDPALLATPADFKRAAVSTSVFDD